MVEFTLQIFGCSGFRTFPPVSWDGGTWTTALKATRRGIQNIANYSRIELPKQSLSNVTEQEFINRPLISQPNYGRSPNLPPTLHQLAPGRVRNPERILKFLSAFFGTDSGEKN